MAEIEITESTLNIHLKGVARFIAFVNKMQLTIPLTHIGGVAIDPVAIEQVGHEEEQAESPWHISVGFAGVEIGWEKTWRKDFWKREMHRTIGPVPLAGGQAAFWDGGNPKESILIRLTDESYALLVLKVADPASTLTKIERAVQARKPS